MKTGPPKTHQNVCVQPNENCPDAKKFLPLEIVRIATDTSVRWPKLSGFRHIHSKNSQKNPKKCQFCSQTISDTLQTPLVANFSLIFTPRHWPAQPYC